MIRTWTMKTRFFPAVIAASLGTIRPASTHAFGFGFSDLIARPTVVFPPETELFHREGEFAILEHSSPRYEITSNEEKFQIAIELPGLKPEDVTIRVEENRRVLSVEGVREKTGEGYSFSSKFSQSFTLDPSIEADKFEAKLKAGVLLVSAPKDHTKVEQKMHTIPVIQEDGEPEESIKVEDVSSADASNAPN